MTDDKPETVRLDLVTLLWVQRYCLNRALNLLDSADKDPAHKSDLEMAARTLRALVEHLRKVGHEEKP